MNKLKIMMTKEVQKTLDYITKKDIGIKKENIISYFEFGSTFQGTSDKYSDIDICYLYLNSLDEFLYDKSNIKSKKYDGEIEGRFIPIQIYFELFKKYSYDSFLLLDALLDNGNQEINELLFSPLLDKKIYSDIIYSHQWQLLNSFKGNLKTYLKIAEKKGLDGKLMIKIIMMINMYSKFKVKDIQPKYFSRLTSKQSEIVTKYKRLSPEELEKTELVDFNKNLGMILINQELKSSKQFLELSEEIYRNLEKDIKLIEDKPEYKGESYDDKYLKQIEKSIKELYIESFK